MFRFAIAHDVPLDWTFYCALEEDGRHDEEVTKLGARVIHSPVPLRRKVAFVRALRHELRQGNYDVIHCHHDLVSAVYLLAAVGLPIRKRIVHIHNADEALPTPNQLKILLYRPLLRAACLAMADRIIGISNHALDTFLGKRIRRPGKDLVHYYGVDASPFEIASKDRAAFRRELGLAENSRLLLFAGRMVPEKNPLFALEVFAQLKNLDSTAAGVFVGTGSLDDGVRQRASELGVEAAFRHLGWRDDVAKIMCCCDWFILPRPEHPMEGFGLAVVEAQLAGLRMLLSRAIPDDPLLPTARYRRLAIADGPRAWANAAIDLLKLESPCRAEARIAFERSAFAMNQALHGLFLLHQECR